MYDSDRPSPDTTSPPGERLQEVLQAQGMTRVELASRLGISLERVNAIIAGREPVTEEIAMQLAQLFGLSAEFWRRREQQYRQHVARPEEERSKP
jgi:addiction module HigA family antidote